jgi:glycerol kinase
MAAAYAKGIDLINLRPEDRSYSVKLYHDTYLPTTTVEDRRARNNKWRMAIARSYGWVTKTKSTQMSNERYILLSSIPFTLYLTASFALLVASEMFS